MLIANYQGRSFTSKAIRFLTRSKYSHSAFLFDAHTEKIAIKLINRGEDMRKLEHIHEGAVAEAWEPGGVRNTESLSDGHTRGTPVDLYELAVPLTDDEEERLILLLIEIMGEPYDWKNVLRFITKRPGGANSDWFCSEMVTDRLSEVGRKLFQRTAAWEVPPDWVPRSTILKFKEATVTT